MAHVPVTTRRSRGKRSVDLNTPFARALKSLPKNIDRPERTYCGLVRQPVTCLLPRSHDIHLAKKAPTRPSALTSALPVPRQVHYERRLYGTPAIDSSSGLPSVNLAYVGKPPPLARVPLRPAQTRAAPTAAQSSSAPSGKSSLQAGVGQAAGRATSITANGYTPAPIGKAVYGRVKPLATLPKGAGGLQAGGQHITMQQNALAKLPPPTQQQQNAIAKPQVSQQVSYSAGRVVAPPQPSILAHNVRQQVASVLASRGTTAVTASSGRVIMPPLYQQISAQPPAVPSRPNSVRPTVAIRPAQPVSQSMPGQPVTIRLATAGRGSSTVPITAGVPLTLQSTGKGNWTIMAQGGRPQAQVVLQPQKLVSSCNVLVSRLSLAHSS